jgi:uncharacterized lipoprotein YmbA
VHNGASHNGASQIAKRFARRPYATLTQISDLVKVTVNGASQFAKQIASRP